MTSMNGNGSTILEDVMAENPLLSTDQQNSQNDAKLHFSVVKVNLLEFLRSEP